MLSSLRKGERNMLRPQSGLDRHESKRREEREGKGEACVTIKVDSKHHFWVSIYIYIFVIQLCNIEKQCVCVRHEHSDLIHTDFIHQYH